MRTGLAIFLLVVAALWASVATYTEPVYGHANQARSSPSPDSVLEEAPTRVAVWFTEPIEPDFSEIRVLDAQGARVDDGESLVDPADGTAMSIGVQALPNGTYTVAWKNVSTVDGHLVRGSFLFSVGEPISGEGLEATSPPPLKSPGEPVLKWLVLLGILTMVGGLAFELLVSRPVMLARTAGSPLRNLHAALSARSNRLMWLALAIFLGASVAQLLLQTSNARDASILGVLGSPLWSMVADTEWGRVWAWRVLMGAGFALSMAGVAVAGRRAGLQGASSRLDTAFRLLGLVFGGAALWTLSLTSHGAATAGFDGLRCRWTTSTWSPRPFGWGGCSIWQ